ncbi:MAG: ABC-2 family transporter protein [Clostridiales bacterium]|jgi:ABC-2 type transport system permease protein|nr:ABC-2 family transporter protein [Clostridiales bacterium]
MRKYLSTSSVDILEGELLMFSFKIPGVLFKGVFKAVFHFILPYGVMATVPTQLLSGTLSMHGLLQALGAVAVFTVFALWFWRFGLKHYKSASS